MGFKGKAIIFGSNLIIYSARLVFALVILTVSYLNYSAVQVGFIIPTPGVGHLDQLVYYIIIVPLSALISLMIPLKQYFIGLFFLLAISFLYVFYLGTPCDRYYGRGQSYEKIKECDCLGIEKRAAGERSRRFISICHGWKLGMKNA